MPSVSNEPVAKEPPVTVTLLLLKEAGASEKVNLMTAVVAAVLL